MKFSAELVEYDGKDIAFKIFGNKPALDLNSYYSIDIKPYKSKRSTEQNCLMWAIIQKIAQVTGNDEMDVYCSGLEELNIQADFFMGLPETEHILKKQFRAVKIMENRMYNGKLMTVFKCYTGSSKFDTAEMTQLIDYFLKLAEDAGIREFECISD